MEKGKVWDAFWKEIKFLELQDRTLEKTLYDKYTGLTTDLDFINNIDKVSCEIHWDENISFVIFSGKYRLKFTFDKECTKFYYSIFRKEKISDFTLLIADINISVNNLCFYIQHINGLFLYKGSVDENR